MESVTVQAARAAPSLVRPTVYRVVRSVSGAEGWDLGMCVYRVRWVNYLFESCMFVRGLRTVRYRFLSLGTPLTFGSGTVLGETTLETDTGVVTACSSGSRKTPRTEGGLRYIPTDYHHDAR